MKAKSHKAIFVLFLSLGLLLGTTVATAGVMTAPRPASKATVMRAVSKPMVKKAAPKKVVAKPAVKKSVKKPAAPKAVAPKATVPVMTAAPAVATTTPVMAPAPAATTPTTATPPVEKKAESTTKKDSKGSVIGGWGLEILIYLAGLLLIALKGVLIKWLWKKYELDKYVSADQADAMVDKAVVIGINYAEEQAHKLHDDPVDGAKKMDLAISAINKYLKDSGLPEKGADYLSTLVEAKLPEIRNAATEAPKPEEAPKEEKEEEKAEEPKEDKPKEE